MKTEYGCVAQLVAQLTLNQLVVGSSPTTPNFIKKLLYGGFFDVWWGGEPTWEGSSASELRAECVCILCKNTEAKHVDPLNANEQEGPTTPKIY